ncbi:MAG: bifunctional oligoribonuclease/PAP phosphatase NrnA [Bacteroidales bacterium]|nr:bifunctional oligoribonuclease/PAP phosphatase NrnA [Bacteroidales bacterium]
MKTLCKDSISSFVHLIRDAARPVIVTHTKPDGDAFGSSIAMYHFLISLGKDGTRIVLSNRYPHSVDFLADSRSVNDTIICEENKEEALRTISEGDLIICLDFNSFPRTGMLEDALSESTAAKVLIDHHLGPDAEKFRICFSEPEISSASELLYHIFMAMPQTGGNADKLPEQAATALMTGMITDTNNFANSTYPSTLAMASSLIASGVDRDMILRNLFQRFGEMRLRLLGHILKDLLRITEDGVAYMILDSETLRSHHVAEGDTEGFVNMPLSIEKVGMSIMLKEDGDTVRVSIRSKPGISANTCAKLHFNGGGHENAAGGKLVIGKEIASMEQAEEYVRSHAHIYMTTGR